MTNRLLVFCLTVLITITGCQSPALFHQTHANIADVSGRVKEADAKSDAIGKPMAPLVVNPGLYVDSTPISLAKQPSWLKNHILLRGEQLPFSYYSRTLVGGHNNILTHYQVDLDPATRISLNYSGDVKGALDLLAAKTGYVYSINGNDIYWQAYVTKTFEIAFMPGSTDYLMGKTGGGASSSAAGGAGTTSGIIDDSASSQYSNLKGTISVWKDLEETIHTLLSPSGKVMVSQATTSVTVHDKPTNIALVSKFIENLNKSLSKQVLVKVQILEITLNSDFNYGIDWSLVERGFGGSNIVLNANYGTPVSIQTLTGAPIPSGGLQLADGRTTGLTMLINALKQQGKVSVVSEPRVVCLNNQVSAIRIVDQQGYAASISSTSLAGSGAGGSSVTSSITPGTLVTGLTLYILPKILNDKVYMQVNADLSNKIKIDDFYSGADKNSTKIQLPHITQKQFNQRSVIGSGDTLILSGFRRVQNQVGAMQFLNSQALGGMGATQSNTETIILITPIVLNGLI